MTRNIETDLLVIGWGKGGKTLAAKAAAAGRRVVMIERDTAMVGGTCINIACVPTKTLVHSASERRPDDDPAEYLAAAIKRRDVVVEKLNAANRAKLEQLDQVTIIFGEAAFVGERRVRVSAGDETVELEAEHVIVNTGTRPRPLDSPGGDLPHVHDSTTMQHAELPQRLAIIGAGPIGLEFADMFARFGSKVTLLSRGQVLADADSDVRDSVLEALRDDGVEIVEGAEAEEITATAVRTSAGEFAADAVLAAIGRLPVVPAGLELAGIELDEKGFIKVDDRLRTSASGVWAVGDINGGPQFTYISMDDFRIVAAQLLGDDDRRRSDRVAVPRTTFLTPPLAEVGLSERDAREQDRKIKVAAKPVAKIAAMPRPKAVGETHGLFKVVVDAQTDEIVGATYHGVDAQEVINLIALAMRAGVPASELGAGIYTHPSSTEALNELLG